jgi:hypothetical protein
MSYVLCLNFKSFISFQCEDDMLLQCSAENIDGDTHNQKIASNTTYTGDLSNSGAQATFESLGARFRIGLEASSLYPCTSVQ